MNKNITLYLALGLVTLFAIGGALFVRQKFLNRKAFLDTLLPDAKTLEKETGVKAIVTLSQALHESGDQGSLLARQYNNLFGIKASPNWRKTHSNYALMSTKEELANGQKTIVGDYFRVYGSFLDSMRDWATIIKTNFPQAYFAALDGDVDGFARGLKNGKYGAYATDSNYYNALLARVPQVRNAEGLA